MTPKIVKIEGVKTPPNVPNPVVLASITLEDDSGARDVIARNALDHLNLAGNGAGMPPHLGDSELAELSFDPVKILGVPN